MSLKIIFIRGILVAGFIFFTLLALLYSLQRSLLYFPPLVPSLAMVQKYIPDYKPVQVRTEDGLVIQGYFHAPQDPERPIILAFHGNGGLAFWMAQTFERQVADGYGVLLAEYRGYGGNEGAPSEDGLSRDADAYLDFLLSDEKLKTHLVVLYGQSLGSGVAIDLAQRNNERVGGLVLEVPFYSVVDVVERVYPFVPFPELLVEDRFLSNQKIANISIPKLFLLAGKDEVVGVDGGKRLYAIARDPKVIKIYGHATHMGVYAAGASRDLNEFLNEEIKR